MGDFLVTLNAVSGDVTDCSIGLAPHTIFVEQNIFCALAQVQVTLQHIAFQNVGCSINACRAVGELLQNSQELRSLHLYNNMSDNEGAIAIAQVRPIEQT